MDFKTGVSQLSLFLVLMGSPLSVRGQHVEFDVPAVVPAVETTAIDGAREVTVEIALSSLITGSANKDPVSNPPIDHLLVKCRFRRPLNVVDYAPKTELQSDFEGAVTVSKKRERTDSFGLNLNGQVQTIGGHIGGDDQIKNSDSTQYQKRAPQQAMIAAGTTDRGRGVYFKFRWTADQVLEGEKRFRWTVAVPESWRGGLIDVQIIANGYERPVFGSSKLKTVVKRDFVIAAHQAQDIEAADVAIRVARLDRRLADYATSHRAQSNSLFGWWKRSSKKAPETDWYTAVSKGEADPYLDQHIKKLPMAVRVAVLDYADANRELKELNQPHSKERS